MIVCVSTQFQVTRQPSVRTRIKVWHRWLNKESSECTLHIKWRCQRVVPLCVLAVHTTSMCSRRSAEGLEGKAARLKQQQQCIVKYCFRSSHCQLSNIGEAKAQTEPQTPLNKCVITPSSKNGFGRSRVATVTTVPLESCTCVVYGGVFDMCHVTPSAE